MAWPRREFLAASGAASTLALIAGCSGGSMSEYDAAASALGVRHAHLNMLIDVADIRPKFASWLGIPGQRPDRVIRFGKSPVLPMSLRRPVDAVLD